MKPLSNLDRGALALTGLVNHVIDFKTISYAKLLLCTASSFRTTVAYKLQTLTRFSY
jgi:hypothetical protein